MASFRSTQVTQHVTRFTKRKFVGLQQFVNLHSVCLLVSDNMLSSTTSRPSVSCPLHWIVHHNMGADGGQQVSTATTQQQCLDTCIANSSCVAAEWSSWGCYIHDRYRYRTHVNKDGVRHFEIVRRCYPRSGIRRHRLFLQNFFRSNNCIRPILCYWQIGVGY